MSRSQLLAAGVSAKWLERCVTAGRLHPLHRGIYRVGPLESLRTRAMAAVLACGEAAVVSHETAAALWQLVPHRSGPRVVHVSLPSGDRRRSGLRIHRARGMRRSDVTKLDGIPITTATRTLLDIAATEERELARALSEALTRRLSTRAGLLAALERRPCGAGVGALRCLLADGRATVTRSEAERRFLRMIREASLRTPETNTKIKGFDVDFFWRAERFVVEIDGFATHALSDRFESDRLRDATLAAAGLRVTRVTWRQLVNEPLAVVARLAQALARSASLP